MTAVCMQEAAHCRDNAKQLAMGYLTSEVDNIADEDVFQLAIVSYALSHGQTGRIKSTQRLFAQIRNDCKFWFIVIEILFYFVTLTALLFYICYSPLFRTFNVANRKKPNVYNKM